jgi:hypothetical protein
VSAFTCLWYSAAGPAPVTVILIRDKSKTGYDIALVTTDNDPDIVPVIERYAARWAIEVAIEDAKQLFGTGQARVSEDWTHTSGVHHRGSFGH